MTVEGINRQRGQGGTVRLLELIGNAADGGDT